MSRRGGMVVLCLVLLSGLAGAEIPTVISCQGR
jgi:hypothetical protein